ncbi:MAG: dTMP kinase [Rhodothermales bacterium]
MLITFEGIDGSGKSTQAYLIDFDLEAAGYQVTMLHEPGSTALSEQIRSLLLSPDSKIYARAELALFWAARAQLVEEVIQPALSSGHIVICDRFYDSTTAYQGGGRGVADYDVLREFNQFITGGVVPQRTYFIDVPVELAFERRAGRSADRIEASGLQFYRRVREAYLQIAESEPERVVVIDGARPIDAVREEIKRDLEGLLPELVTGTGTVPSGSPPEQP